MRYSASGSNGSIEPKTVTVNLVSLTIGEIYSTPSNKTSTLFFSSQVTTSGLLYIGRYDTKLKTEVQLRQNTEVYPFFESIFSESDVDKDIPIWLSTTPPPLWA